tara:strand:- start:407 stop:1036 length:630 start_codon:yes stop_codon:yes gene_type:complete
MKTTRNITLAIFISILLFSCKEAVKNSNSPVVEITVNQPATKKKKDNTRKIAKVNIKATVNGEDFSLTTYNPEKSTDVIYQNNAVQFRITDFSGQSVLVNLQSPDMFSQKPFTIRQQTAALPIQEVHGTKEQSKLSFDFKSEDPAIPIIYEMYDGELVVEKFSDTKIVITFNGRGFRWGINNKEANLFPIDGSIVIENFSINDFRITEE